MIKKLWLPAAGTIILISLIFVKNISVQNNDARHYDTEEHLLNNLAGKYDINYNRSEGEGLYADAKEDFEQFLKAMGNAPFKKESISYIDTTGDGFKEEVRESAIIVDNKCMIDQKIIKKGKCIWHENFSLSKQQLSMFFNDEELNDELSDYSLYYLASCLSPFIEKLELNSLHNDRIKRLALNAPENKGFSPKECFESDLMKDLENYKGHYVFRREIGQEAIFMWDSELNLFKEIYPNQSFSI